MNKKTSRKMKITFKFLAGLGVVISLVIGLGILRFHAARLAYYLESVNQSIQKYSEEEVILRQELSALVAPIRIYSYCKENLGMQKVLKAETLPIRSSTSGTFTAAKKNSSSESKGLRFGLAWLLER